MVFFLYESLDDDAICEGSYMRLYSYRGINYLPASSTIIFLFITEGHALSPDSNINVTMSKNVSFCQNKTCKLQ